MLGKAHTGIMKMTASNFTVLRVSIEAKDTEAVRERYRAGDFLNSDRVSDLNKRYRWDLAHSAVGSGWICDQYALGLNDSHIDTALRAIVSPL